MTEKWKSIDDDLYLIKRKLGELFDSAYPFEVNLWRGQKPAESGQPILYPILKSFLLSNGKTRDPDIATYSKSGELWVDSRSGPMS